MLKTVLLLFVTVMTMGHAEISLEDQYRLACEAQSKSYSPYSRYKVGCAVLAKSGKVYTGCNVENASYGVCICGERTALVKAVSEGDREFTRLVIVTKDGGMSCGICRQMMNEFSPEMEIVTFNEAGDIVAQEKLSEILPHAFGPSSLS